MCRLLPHTIRFSVSPITAVPLTFKSTPFDLNREVSVQAVRLVEELVGPFFRTD